MNDIGFLKCQNDKGSIFYIHGDCNTKAELFKQEGVALWCPKCCMGYGGKAIPPVRNEFHPLKKWSKI